MNAQLQHFIKNNPAVKKVYLDDVGNFVTAPCVGYSEVSIADLEDGGKKAEDNEPIVIGDESSATQIQPDNAESIADLEDGGKKAKNKK